MVIDTHAHIIVPEITRQAAPQEAWRPQVSWEDGRQLIDFGGKKIPSAIADIVHVEAILESQLAAGIQHVLLCPWVSILRYDAAPDEGLRLSQIQNEALAKLAQTYPQRVSALGTVPLQDPELAARSLQELMSVPGLHGVEISSSVRGVYLGDDRFRPIWEAAEASGALIFIHPSMRGFDLPVFNEYYMWNSVANPLETTITAAHLIMAGVLELHPRLKILLAHGGGALLALRGRLRHSHALLPQAKSRLQESPEVSLKRFFFDTVTHDADLLRSLVDYVGPEQVLLGSDYPFIMGDARPLDTVRALNLPGNAEERILGGNAARLLGLED